MKPKLVSARQNSAGHKKFYALLTLLLSCCFAEYVFGLYIPQLIFMAIGFLTALVGDEDEIAALCICCVPMHNYMEYAFVVLFAIICHVVKNGAEIRMSSRILPIVFMILWELAHSFMPGFNPMQFGGNCVIWLMLAVFMCTTKHEYDYAFIVRAFAYAVAAICFSLLGKVAYDFGWSFSVMMLNMQRLGVDAELGGTKVNPNTLGILCVVASSGLLQLRLAARGRKGDVLGVLLLLVFGVMTASRTYLVCLAFAVMLFLFAAKGSTARKIRYGVYALVICAVVLVLSYIIMPDMLRYFLVRFTVDDITTGRIATMGEYQALMFSNWGILFHGIGLQDFSNRILAMCPKAIFVPHNGIQEVILAWGLPGLVLIAALFYVMYVQSRKQCRHYALINLIPFLVLFLKTFAGQLITSPYTMMMLSFAYFSMCTDFSQSEALPDETDKADIPVVLDRDGIELGRTVKFLWNKWGTLVVITLVSALAAFGVTKYFVTPTYESKVLVYVNNDNVSVEDIAEAITSNDLVASRTLVSTYRVILQSRQTLNEVIRLSGVQESYEEVSQMITAEPENDTEVLKITVTHPDPLVAERIANAVAEVLPAQISATMDATTMKIVDYAVAATAPSAPSKSVNTLIGAMIGFVVGAMLLLLYVIRDTKIYDYDLTAMFSYPLLAEIPDLTKQTKGSKYYYQKS